MEKFWILLSTAVLIVSFQNCSNSTDFSATDELISKTEGEGLNVALDTSHDPLNGSNHDIVNNDASTPHDDAETTPSATTPPASEGSAPPAMPPVATNPSPDRDSDDGVKPPTQVTVQPPTDSSEASDDSSNSELQFVCVLRSHGKSVKVGVVNNTLSGNTGTPNDVCMSENACVNILSKKFDVVGAEKRGFCPSKNPNVVSMTDAQIEAALAKAALLASVK